MPVSPESDAVRPDPLSAGLDGLRATRGRYYRSLLAQGWSVSFARTEGCVFHLLTRGHATLWVGGAAWAAPPGALLLLPHGDAHIIGEHPDGLAVAFPDEATTVADWTFGAPPVAELVCGELLLRESAVLPLLRPLPAVLRVPDDGPVASLLALLQGEAARGGPGHAAFVSRLVEVLALHAIRAWLTRPDAEPSWVTGTRDPGVARVLAAVHADPGGDWTVERLARVAGQSRSRFTARFSELVGTSPAAYVRGLRLRAAAEALQAGGRVGEVAGAGGYGSQAAFSRAFKRSTGRTPSEARGRVP
jgi:AraC-like DNA-binding protein